MKCIEDKKGVIQRVKNEFADEQVKKGLASFCTKSKYDAYIGKQKITEKKPVEETEVNTTEPKEHFKRKELRELDKKNNKSAR